MHSLLIHFASMGHPYASLQTIFNFMWCIWKARNDFLFERKFSFPYQIKIAATSLNNILQEEILPSTNIQSLQASQPDNSPLPKQGNTLKSDLLINGAKVFSDAAFRTSRVPGFQQGQLRTGVGVYFCLPSSNREINIQVQASGPSTDTPLQAEAIALACAAQLAACLNIQTPTFLTDSLSLATVAAARNIAHSSTPWNIRKEVASFVNSTSNLNPQVFHISRNLNGVAHNLAHQVFQMAGGPTLNCSSHSHVIESCPLAASLVDFNFVGIQLHKVYCF